MSENLNETNQAVEDQEAAAPAESPPEATAETPSPEAGEASEGEARAESAAGDDASAAADDASAAGEGVAAEIGAEMESEPQADSGADSGEGEEVRRAEFSPLKGGAGAAISDNLDLVLGVTVPVTIELGGAEMFFRDIMAIGPGSVVRLDRPIGEPVDLLVNGELVGRGEVVVVDDRYGLRVTELCHPVSEKKEAK
ncbi:MAG: flagellar motor switch protein FliN [Candidatus Eisenbacteria bacterium]|nr:flagellar motor switch protein FliN [Candidatus Eisenbacteria bacterium]